MRGSFARRKRLQSFHLQIFERFGASFSIHKSTFSVWPSTGICGSVTLRRYVLSAVKCGDTKSGFVGTLERGPITGQRNGLVRRCLCMPWENGNLNETPFAWSLSEMSSSRAATALFRHSTRMRPLRVPAGPRCGSHLFGCRPDRRVEGLLS